jgi:hypothetical protein
MAILGCGDAGTACEAVTVAPARYESVSACMAAQEDVLARTDIMYPVVMAECRPASGATPAAFAPKTPKPATDTKRLLKQASLRT